MTQAALNFDAKPTLLWRLEEFFRSVPGIWIDGRQLARIAGSYGWRSRVSDLRTQRGLTIENRQRHIKTPQGQFTVSEYRWVR